MSKIKIGFWILVIILSSLIYLKIKNIKGTQTLSVHSSSTVNPTEKPKSLIYYKKILSMEKETVNVLLLGLDGRAGDNRPRCDAIHMISFYQKDNKIIITSVPRGTYIDIDGVASESAYISNACHVKGIDYAVGEIEKITGLKADYLVKVGFSQTIGILRLLNLPTTSTLQFLRNRQVGGDFQRTHNQALFIKDMFVNYFESFMALPGSLKYIAFTLVDTNLTYNNAYDLLIKIQNSALYKNPDNIVLIAKPSPDYKLSDIHYPFKENTNQTDDWEYQEYQNEIRNIITQIIQKADSQYTNNDKVGALQTVATPFRQKLWEQVEDQHSRNELHFEFLRLFVLSSGASSQNTLLVKDFITQMEVDQDLSMMQKGQKLLSQL